MASTPNAERVFRVLTKIIERRYDVKIEYILEDPGHSGRFLSRSCCENETKPKGENYEYNYNSALR
jgi:hypothetical protein